MKKINKEVQKKVIGGRVTARTYNNTYPDITADGMIYNMMKDAEDINNDIYEIIRQAEEDSDNYKHYQEAVIYNERFYYKINKAKLKRTSLLVLSSLVILSCISYIIV